MACVAWIIRASMSISENYNLSLVAVTIILPFNGYTQHSMYTESKKRQEIDQCIKLFSIFNQNGNESGAQNQVV